MIVRITLERPNREDFYYTDSDNYLFHTNENISKEYLTTILEGITLNKIKDKSSNCSFAVMYDYNDLVEKLKDYNIYPIKFDMCYCFEREEIL